MLPWLLVICRHPDNQGLAVFDLMKKCGKKAISTKENISKEVDFIKDESSKDYNWETCGKSFSEALSLKKHIPHNSWKPQRSNGLKICDLCDNSFSTVTYCFCSWKPQRLKM